MGWYTEIRLIQRNFTWCDNILIYSKTLFDWDNKKWVKRRKDSVQLFKILVEVVQPRKIRPKAKIHNFTFKNSNIVIQVIIQKEKDYFS